MLYTLYKFAGEREEWDEGEGGGMIGGRRREQKGKIEEGEDDTEEKDEAGETGNRILSIQEKKNNLLDFYTILAPKSSLHFHFLVN